MARSPATFLLIALACGGLGAQERDSDTAATAALQRLCERLKDMRTLSARIVQTRRTELLDKPIVSSGLMYYRREPARLVFHLSEPRKAEIHLDRNSYQVYRPDERRLERFDFGADSVPGMILMVFEPKMAEIRKSFTIRGSALEVVLEPSDERARRRLKKIVLTISETDAALKGITTTDAEGDDVRFDLSDVAINPDVASSLFALQVPEGTRVLRQAVKPDK